MKANGGEPSRIRRLVTSWPKTTARSKSRRHSVKAWRRRSVVGGVFQTNEIFVRLAPPNYAVAIAGNENFGCAWPRVVVRGKTETVCSSTHDREQVARLQDRNLTVLRNEICRLADWPND